MGQGPTALLIPRRHMQIMLDHVLGSHVEEACGLLGGTGNRVEQVIPVENALHSPSGYRMERRAQVRALFAIEDAGLSLVGIFHSHPAGPPHLSSQDLREAYYPEAAYLVWAQGDNGWVCKAFRLEGGGAREIPILLMGELGTAA